MRNSTRIQTVVTAGVGVLGMVALSACGAAETGGDAGSDKVTIAVPSWVGAEANAAVASYLLEKELDVKAQTRQMDEPVAWDALHSGDVDAILEDWRGFPAKEKKYIDEKKTVVEGGDLGVTGHIGWFVPKYWADKHPDVTNWKNLNKYTDELKTSESGDKGQLLEGSPSYVTHDPHLIKNLDINLKTVYAGSEAAQITEIRKNYQQKKPFISYWWTPQWLNAELDLVEVKLPEYKEGCDKVKEKVACAYPNTPLQKYFNAKFAKDGGKAAEFLKNFKWTDEHQNEVARLIKVEKMSSEEAAQAWAEKNKDVWEAWIPQG